MISAHTTLKALWKGAERGWHGGESERDTYVCSGKKAPLFLLFSRSCFLPPLLPLNNSLLKMRIWRGGGIGRLEKGIASIRENEADAHFRLE